MNGAASCACCAENDFIYVCVENQKKQGQKISTRIGLGGRSGGRREWEWKRVCVDAWARDRVNGMCYRVSTTHMKSRWSFHINCITFVMRPHFRRSECTMKFMLPKMTVCDLFSYTVNVALASESERATERVNKCLNEIDRMAILNDRCNLNVVGGKAMRSFIPYIERRYVYTRTHTVCVLCQAKKCNFFIVCNRHNRFDCVEGFCFFYCYMLCA